MIDVEAGPFGDGLGYCDDCQSWLEEVVNCPEYPAKCDFRGTREEVNSHLFQVEELRKLWEQQMEEDSA